VTTRFTPQGIAEMQQLTKEYASFSRSRSGLGNVLGGVVGLLVFGAVWLLGQGPAAAAITVGLTSVWLVGKELIRQRVYRCFGQAREVWTGAPQRGHRILVLLFTLLLCGFAVVIVAGGWLARPIGWPYLLFCLATPVIAWRYLYTTHELSMGFGLLFMCAVTVSGHMPELLGLLIVPAYAAAMIPLGLHEHRQFRVLATRLLIKNAVRA